MKFDAHKYVTDLMIEGLKKGRIPWKKPWKLSGPKFPTNMKTDNFYHGINTLVLSNIAYAKGFKSNWWMGYHQAIELGGNVRKGEKGSWCLICNPIMEKDDKTKLKYMYFSHRTVFNIDQIDGIEVEPEPQIDFNPVQAAEDLLASMQHVPEIKESLTEASYIHSPILGGTDYIYMPKKDVFSHENFYYSTLFHEITHSTNNPARLNRESLEYAEEELVAELGSSILCTEAGIIEETKEHSQAYINGWISKLENDPKMIMKCSSLANRAIKYLLPEEAEAEKTA